MKNQKVRRILNAAGIALIFFVTQCRGSGNADDGKSIWDAVGQFIAENNLENVMEGQESPAKIVGNDMPGTSNNGDIVMIGNDNMFFDPIYNMPGSSKSGDAMMGSKEVDLDDLVLDENGPNIWNPLTTTEKFRDMYEIHPQPEEDFGDSRNAFNSVHTVYDLQNEADRIDNDEITIIEPDKFNGAQKRVEYRQMQQQRIDAFNQENNMIVPSVDGHRAMKEHTDHMLSMDDASMLDPEKDKKVKLIIYRKRKAEVAPDPSNSHYELREKKKRDKMTTLNTNLWNNLRLTNKRRESSYSLHVTLYTSDRYRCFFNSSKDIKTLTKSIEKNIKEEIKIFYDVVKKNNLIEKNEVLYLVASRSVNLNTKYGDLLWLDAFLNDAENIEYRELVETFKGYYPNVFKDLRAYVDKYKPLITDDFSATEWNETLGDIYMREDLDLNYEMVGDQKKISKLDSNYYALAYALRMILALPEVCQDFSQVRMSLIKQTQIYAEKSKDESAQLVLSSLCTLAKESPANAKTMENVYKDIYNALHFMYRKDVQYEPTVSELYKNVYTILADFYEKATICDEDKYILLGKCVIKHQVYTRCAKTLGFTPDGSFGLAFDPEYSPEKGNTWIIPLDIQLHYHVYYVDNEERWSRKLCMPIYTERGSNEKHYIHTIGDIVEYTKRLYGIEKDIVHPFKVRKGTREWSYIEKGDERNLTVKDLEEYEVVFYRIEEDLATTEFIFAEFWPLSHESEKRIRIPLFFTRLMLDAEDLGPFKKKGIHAKINTAARFRDIVPNVYEFDVAYKKDEYSNVHGYYKNLCIMPDEEKTPSLDCYIMAYRTGLENNSVKVVWYVNMTKGANAYTHCLMNKNFREDPEKVKQFFDVLESRKYNRDSTLQSIWLKNSNMEDIKSKDQAEKIYTWQVEDQKEKEAAIEEESITKMKNKTKINNRTKEGKKKLKTKLKTEREKIRAEVINFNKTNKMLNRLLGLEEEIEELKKLGKIKELEELKRAEGITNNTSEIKKLEKKKKATNTRKYTATKRLKAANKELQEAISEKPYKMIDLIVFRNVNTSKSNLGVHNEILDSFITLYKKCK
ncbi:hypothetical protein NEMIN01_2141 [Nematocida minor]|uniref:uncharacterized protein n=1 Tax=Nematocida minor TaxID=1912983 RepID=UPI00221F5AFB|nr:uncharacterized protein NEMIN01_2141 [Nematocida minor]KAI5192674.1 hypothetical protein NEMIN01_2141 [Nematocida minor]